MKKWDSHKATEALWTLLIAIIFALMALYLMVVNPFDCVL